MLQASQCNNNGHIRIFDTNLLDNTHIGSMLTTLDGISNQRKINMELQLSLARQVHSVGDIDNHETNSMTPLQRLLYDRQDYQGVTSPQAVISNAKGVTKLNFSHQEDQLQLRLQQQQLAEEQFRHIQQQYQLEQQLQLLQQQEQQQQMNQLNNHVPPQRSYSMQLPRSTPSVARNYSGPITPSDPRVFQHTVNELPENLVEADITGRDSGLYEPRPLDPHYVQRHRNTCINDGPDSPTNYETEDVGPLPVLRSGTFRENSCSSLENVFSSPDGIRKVTYEHSTQPINKASHRLALSAHMAGNSSGTMSLIDDDDSSDDDQHQLSTMFNNSMRVSYHGPKYIPKTSYHGSAINGSIHEFDFSKGMSEHSIIPGTSTLEMSVQTIEGSVARLMTESEMSFASLFDDGERRTA
jgi:hypothetical protein